MLWYGARLVVENKLSPGELSTFVIYAVYVGSNVGALAGVVSSLVQVHCSQTPFPRALMLVPGGHVKSLARFGSGSRLHWRAVHDICVRRL